MALERAGRRARHLLLGSLAAFFFRFHRPGAAGMLDTPCPRRVRPTA
ncbi:hypothetical protein KYY02_31565 [Streptomyces pimonensis]|uniref:Uncharacterized protein n=1 Tax=Streptomyces pimonensis TaxID=2860288 RepID=A0ABV4J7W6_9ACTN